MYIVSSIQILFSLLNFIFFKETCDLTNELQSMIDGNDIFSGISETENSFMLFQESEKPVDDRLNFQQYIDCLSSRPNQDFTDKLWRLLISIITVILVKIKKMLILLFCKTSVSSLHCRLFKLREYNRLHLHSFPKYWFERLQSSNQFWEYNKICRNLEKRWGWKYHIFVGRWLAVGIINRYGISKAD